MQVITLSDDTKLNHPTVLTMGNFDGIHLGHRILLEKLVARSEQQRTSSVVVTFEPHTREVIHGGQVPRISTLDEKIILLEPFEIDYLVIIPFNKEIAFLGKEDFREQVLVNQLNMTEFIMGEDHRFGRNKTIDEKSLSFHEGKKHFSTIKIQLYGENSITAGSTEVRDYLTSGEISEAVNMLGHPYLIQVTRVRGVQKGTEIGYPTLNFSAPPSQKIVPPVGVYVAEVAYGDHRLKGCLYFGDCPTFGDRDIHFEFFSLDLVDIDPAPGDSCAIWVHHYIRPDKEFDCVEDLVKQIDNDVKTIKKFFVKE